MGKFEIAKIGEKTWRAILTCKEVPAMNDIYVVDLDKEACFDDNLMGGTNKLTMTMPNENTLKIVSEHSTMGKTDMQEVYSDQGITITVKTKAGGYWTVSSDSKVFLYNITYKLGEEFEWDMSGVPGMPEGMDLRLKCRETCVAKDKYVMVTKHPDGKATKSVTEVTPNFMVKKDYLVGSSLCSTTILMKC